MRQQLLITTDLGDEKVEQLYAWLCRALTGDPRYNDLMTAFLAIFADEDGTSPYTELVREALAGAPAEDTMMGDPLTLRQREEASLGAMGAGQWTGQFRTRPHALLDVSSLRSVDDWVASLPRGARRTLAKANALAESGEFSVIARPIRGGERAPHSTLAHFKCVVEHEV